MLFLSLNIGRTCDVGGLFSQRLMLQKLKLRLFPSTSKSLKQRKHRSSFWAVFFFLEQIIFGAINLCFPVFYRPNHRKISLFYELWQLPDSCWFHHKFPVEPALEVLFSCLSNQLAFFF